MKKQSPLLQTLSGIFKPEESFGLDCLKVLIFEVLWFFPLLIGSKITNLTGLPVEFVILFFQLVLLILLPLLHTRWYSHFAVCIALGGIIGAIVAANSVGWFSGLEIFPWLMIGTLSALIQCVPLFIAFLCRTVRNRKKDTGTHIPK